jgi:plasmid stabilization system protein ParE
MDRDEYQIVWTRPATKSLEAIAVYIVADRPDAATRVVAAITDRVRQLSVVPLSGVAFPRGSDGRVREVASGKYRIFYRIDATCRTIEILEVRHGAQLSPPAQDW